MGRWKCKKWGKIGESVNIKKWFNIKKRKIEKKNDNDVDVDVAQLGRNNNKCYISVYIYIYVYLYLYFWLGVEPLGLKVGRKLKVGCGGTTHTKLVPNPPFVSAHLEELPMWTCQTRGNMNHRPDKTSPTLTDKPKKETNTLWREESRSRTHSRTNHEFLNKKKKKPCKCNTIIPRSNMPDEA